MRILLVTGTLPPKPCGVGDYTAKLADALAADDIHQVALLGGDFEKSGQAAGKVVRLQGPKDWKLGEFQILRTAIRGFGADVVHVQTPSQGFRHRRLPDLIPAIAWTAGAAVVRTWHEAPGKRALLPLAVQSIVPGENIVVRQDFLSKVPPGLHNWIARGCALIPSASAIPKAQLTSDERRVLRQHYLTREGRLIMFFGFLYPAKGAEHIFDIADPRADTLIFAGPIDEADPYTQMVRDRSQSDDWAGHVRLLGMLEADAVARLLAVADAVVLPFTSGGGSWNTSILAAVQQGTPVITTSATRLGLDAETLVHYSPPGDLSSMRAALNMFARQRRGPSLRYDRDAWSIVGRRHLAVYRRAIRKRAGR